MKQNYTLTRRDILSMVNDLHKDFMHLLDCEACSLYFPLEGEPQETKYLEEEDKLFIPLKFKNSQEVLAVFLVRKPNKSSLAKVLPNMDTLVHLALEKLSLKKASVRDTHTELFTKEYLITHLSQKIEQMRKHFTELSDFAQTTSLAYGCAGILYLHFANMQEIAKKYGYLFAEECMQELSTIILDKLPHDALIARVNNYDCALMITEDNCDARVELNNFVHNLCNTISSLTFSLPVKYAKHGITHLSCPMYAGYLLFPHDYDNLTAERNPQELAYVLLAQTEYTAKRAYEQKKSFLPFSFLISQGGNIVEVRPDNQFIINLGKNVGLREAMRFSVYDHDNTNKLESFTQEQKRYKGEISILQVFDEHALAEQILLYDAINPFNINDILIKLPDDYSIATKKDSPVQKDILTHLYKYSDFLTLFSELKQKLQTFTLALLQVEIVENTNSIPMENILAEIMQIFDRSIIEKYDFSEKKEECIAARYGDNGILIFLPQTSSFTLNKTLEAYQDLAKELTEHLNQKIAIGVAQNPFLDFKAIDALENAKKALECAKLLEFPYVGLCNSIALTVSADKLAEQGMFYDALQEYQYAILQDEKNALAQNSLGVILFSLGRHAAAQKAFLEALKLTPNDISIFYNLAGICLELNDLQEAKKYYEKCLTTEEYQYLALLQLGQIAEMENDLTSATDYYTRAIEKEAVHASPYRLLAKVSLNEGNKTRAKEFLYTALRHTPYDPMSLVLLATIYLENNEDPNVIAGLLSPIMTERQKNREAWKIYAEVLKAQGKLEEALKAETKLKNLL